MKEFRKMENYYRYNEKQPLEVFEVTEKIDGANFRWKYLSPVDIIFGSRNVFPIAFVKLTQPESWEVRDDTGATLGDTKQVKVPKTFRPFIEFIAEQSLGRPFPEDLEHFTFFGEAVGNHKIDYKVDPKRKVVGFAVWDERIQEYRYDWDFWMKLMGVPTVAILNRNEEDHVETANSFLDVTDREKDPSKRLKSYYDEKSRIEGLVFSDYINQSFYKHKVKEFTTKSAKKVTNTWDSVLDKYLTDERFEKLVLKMMNEEIGWNKKNPIPSMIGQMSKDIVEAVDMEEIQKVLRKVLMKSISQRITSNEEYMNKLLEMKE